MTALIGIDVGIMGVKTLAVSPTGEVLARAEESYALSTPHPGWSEQRPDDWWHATQRALRALGAHEIAGIGLAGQMHGLVLLDEELRVLRPAILWNDQRTAAECREIEERVGLDRLVALTGNRALTGFTAPKALWVAKHEPDVWAHAAHLLLPKDYVRLQLTGERATDVADASGTLLFDVAERRFSGAMLELLDIPHDLLPGVHESPESSGETPLGIPVAAGAGDQAAGALGAGVDRPGPFSVNLGTSGVVFAALPGFQTDPQARVHAFCHAVPGAWHAMGVMLSAAGSLEWLRGVVAPEATFDELVAEAERWPPGVKGLTFLPYLAGERTPHTDPDARGAFAGLSVRHDRGALVRAVLEGVAYGLRDSLELLRELGVRPEVGRAVGGGARSRLWTRILASVLGTPLELPEVDEGTAYGAALLGGVAGGVFRDVHEAVGACVRVCEVVEPDSAWRDAYEDGYRRFRALYPSLRGVE